MQDATQLWEPFTTWQFGVTCIAIVAVLQTVKNIGVGFCETLFNSKRAQALLTSANVFIGVACAIPKGFLMGDSFGQRIFTGICAGFMSTFVYHSVIKHLLPDGRCDENEHVVEHHEP